MKNVIIALTLTLVSSFAMASEEVCYQLSANGRAWSRTPELLCVQNVDATSSLHEITLKTGLLGNQRTVATFQLDLTRRVRCADCNRDVFSLSVPSNSVLNALSVRFEGERDLRNGAESGTVRVGATQFFYRR